MIPSAPEWVKAGSSDEEVPEERKVGKRIPVEMTWIQKNKRIVLYRLMVKKGKKFFEKKIGIPNLEYGMYFIDEHQTFNDGIMRYDINWCEPLNPKTGESERNVAVSLVLAGAKMVQRIKVATLITKFILTKQHLMIMGIAAVIGAFGFLSLNPIWHFTPTTVVHWLNQPPRFK